MIRQAVILAAGNGTRMKKGQTDKHILDTPKPLLEVRGMPIIEHSLRKLRDRGIDVAVVIKRKDEELFKEKLGKYLLHFYYQEEPLGTAHALYCAKGFIRDSLFLVLMGDDLLPSGVDEMIQTESPTIFGHIVEDVSGYGCVITDRAGYVLEIKEKSQTGNGIANTGISIMPKAFFDVYKDIPTNSKSGEKYLTDAAKLLYDKDFKFRLINLDYWKGINTPDDLINANRRKPENIKVRKAKVEDFPRIIEMLNELSPMKDVEESKADINLRAILEQILSNEDYMVVVAEAEGEIVSTATLLIQRNFTHGGRPYGHIENVVTDSKYRGSSIGKKVVEHLVELASSMNCYKVILNCSNENVGFYKRCGFETNGEVEMRKNF